MARFPKGSITRSPADWNMRRMYFGQLTGGSNLDPDDESIILSNTSNDGKSLVLWDITVTVGTRLAGVTVVPTVQGQLGQFPVDHGLPTDNVCAPSIPDSPAGAGRTGQAQPGVVLKFSVYSFIFGAGTWQWPHDWPFCVIPPGWNYVWSIFGSTNVWSVAFQYEEIINPYN